MITPTLYGGLGNQLFQLFTVAAVSLKTGHECYFEWNSHSLLATCSLFLQWIPECKSKEECRALEAHLTVETVEEPAARGHHPNLFDVVNQVTNPQRLWVLKGYFQSYRYFEHECSAIVAQLGIRDQQTQLVQELSNSESAHHRLLGQMAECRQQLTTESTEGTHSSLGTFVQNNQERHLITLHFRIGDYKHVQHTHPILPRNYYRNALRAILDKSSPDSSYNIVYVCQAIDQETVEDYYIRPLSAEFESCTWTSISHDMTDAQHLLYMSLSTHHVMANSTFSWWSAYLRPTSSLASNVYYPKLWFIQDNMYAWAVHFHEDMSPPRIMRFHPCRWSTSNPPLCVEDMFPEQWVPIDCPIDDDDNDVVVAAAAADASTVVQSQCLCYSNPIKHASMTRRFETVGMPLSIYEGVPYTDPRILNIHERNNPLAIQRLWSVTYGHLDMIQQFVDSHQPYGIFCEDDIMVNRTLPEHLSHIVQECDVMQLDILLLGYMKTYKVESWMTGHAEIASFPKRPYTYHEYPDDQWGVHMYMLSRKGAERILETYAYHEADTSLLRSEASPTTLCSNPCSTVLRTYVPLVPHDLASYADKYVNDPTRPFSPDWTISKCPGLRRALISPMFAVEDGADPYVHYGHDGQWQFHMDTFRANYVPEVFV